jgi:hypothetical protein
MNTLKVKLDNDGKEEEILFQIKRMVNAGYTGRNQEAVRQHIEELKKEGIPAPESTPTAYEVISKLIYFDPEIEVIGNKTSGEAEFILLCSGEEVYVGVGSDHTDRELESISIIKSKQVCPNVMAPYVWNLRDVRKGWDKMILRSWVVTDKGEKVLYQEAPLSVMMAPEDLMSFVKNKMEDKRLDGIVIYSGTIPLLREKPNYNNYFEVELYNPANGRRLNCAYHIRVLNYLMG